MNLSNLTARRVGLIISVVVSLLINSYQIIFLLFNISPHHGVGGEIIGNMTSPAVDLFINLVYCFILSWLVFELNTFLIDKFKGWFNLLLRLFLSLLIGAILIYIFSHTYIVHASVNDDYKWAIMMHFRSRGVIISFLLVGLVQIFYLYKKNQRNKLEMESLEAENIRSKYIALKNQVDPHFLFNSLNTLGGLISIDERRAQEYLQRLSTIFRYSMRDVELVSVADEVEFAKTFGELMRVRYGDSLQFNFEIPQEIVGRMIMPFSLQLLIENAVKHNVVAASNPLEIKVFYKEERIFVVNNIHKKREKEIGEGIGLVNLSKRYELFGDYTVDIKQSDTIFSVSLPLIKE